VCERQEKVMNYLIPRAFILAGNKILLNLCTIFLQAVFVCCRENPANFAENETTEQLEAVIVEHAGDQSRNRGQILSPWQWDNVDFGIGLRGRLWHRVAHGTCVRVDIR
jgi:hypothetical protein